MAQSGEVNLNVNAHNYVLIKYDLAQDSIESVIQQRDALFQYFHNQTGTFLFYSTFERECDQKNGFSNLFQSFLMASSSHSNGGDYADLFKIITNEIFIAVRRMSNKPIPTASDVPSLCEIALNRLTFNTFFKPLMPDEKGEYRWRYSNRYNNEFIQDYESTLFNDNDRYTRNLGCAHMLKMYLTEHIQYIRNVKQYRRGINFLNAVKYSSLTIEFGQAQTPNPVVVDWLETLEEQEFWKHPLYAMTICMNNSDFPIYNFLSELNLLLSNLSELNITADSDNYIQSNLIELISEHCDYLSCLRYQVQTNLFGFGQLSRLQYLSHLEIESNPCSLDEHELTELVSGCLELKSLNILHDALNLGSNLFTIDSIIENCQHLRELLFWVINGSIDGVMDYQVKQLSHLDGLEVLVLKSFNNITHHSVKCLIQNIPDIKRLTLADCPMVSLDEVITQIRNTVKKESNRAIAERIE